MGLEHLPCEERLGKLDWVSLEKGWLWGHLIVPLLAVPRRGHQGDGAGLMTVVH